MRHILIIDDMENRHEGFRKIFADPKWNLGSCKLHHAKSAAEAIAMLQEARFPPIRVLPEDENGKRTIIEPEPTDWTAIFLDHDCDLQPGPDFIVVVEYIRNNPHILRTKPTFLIHSHNVVGAMRMREILEGMGFRVIYKPFDVPGHNRDTQFDLF